MSRLQKLLEQPLSCHPRQQLFPVVFVSFLSCYFLVVFLFLEVVGVMPAEAAAAAAVMPPEAAALPGGSAAQRENLRKAQQKQREGAIWRQTASCICANLALHWRREGAEFPSTPPAGMQPSAFVT